MLVTRREELWHNGVSVATVVLMGVALLILRREYLDEFGFLRWIAGILFLLSLASVHRFMRALRCRGTLVETVTGDSPGLRRTVHGIAVVGLLAMSVLLVVVGNLEGSWEVLGPLSLICVLVACAIGVGMVRVLKESERKHR